jgi:transcriptional regulator of acetoin/glycerol metabolism
VVRLEAVEVDGRLVGAVGEVLDDDAHAPRASGDRVLSVPEFRHWSPAARRTATALRRAAEDRRATCVVGEDGVGKATTVRIVAARAFPARNLVQVAPEDATPGRIGSELASGSPVLVTDAHALTPEQLLALADTARDHRGDGWLALTYQGQPDALDERLYESRLAILPASPLRARPQDIELAIPAMLRRYAGGRELTLTPALVDRLRREPWPTNFHGLEAVVAEMAHHATKRVLDVADLPEAFGAILRRRLTPMEWMTRSAIVSALQAHGGNKELAAEALGMSRASIYRKIKAFGIDLEETVTD